jgi:predicted DNA-binding transcriptional regulator AlpA
MTDRPNIVGPEYIAELLGMEVSTIKVDARRKPESLPPRLELPGHRKLRWVEADVIAWLNSFRPKEKKKAGRPVSPAYQQYPQG